MNTDFPLSGKAGVCGTRKWSRFQQHLSNKRSSCFSSSQCFMIVKGKEFPCHTRKKNDGKCLPKKSTLLCHLTGTCWHEYIGSRKLLLGNNCFQFGYRHYPKSVPNAVHDTVPGTWSARGGRCTNKRVWTSEQVTELFYVVVSGYWKGSWVLSSH